MRAWELLLLGLVLLAAAMLISLAPARAEPVLLVNDTNGRLASLDLETGGVTVLGDTGVRLHDIAFDQDGQLYGIGPDDLYLIDIRTLEAVSIGQHGIPTANALVFGPDGTLFGAGKSEALFAIDLETGEASKVSRMRHLSAGDLAFHNGTLYLANREGSLVRVDPTGEEPGEVIGDIGFDKVHGLAQGDDGALYGVTETKVFSIDPTTGRGTLIADFAGQGFDVAKGSGSPTEAGADLDDMDPATKQQIGIVD